MTNGDGMSLAVGRDPPVQGDPSVAGWRKDICKKHLMRALATHSGGAAKTAENEVGESNVPALPATACQPRPSLALAYLPTETVDNPVYETW